MKRILVIEDEPQMLLGLRDNLELEGYEVETATDGDEGLQKAATFQPDLVILDVMLPRKNGFDVCRELRARSNTTPVVMLTARNQETDKVLGLELGADDYITKPFHAEEVLARVNTHLALRNMQRQLQERNEALQREVRERERAEQVLAERSRELARSNAELERMAYIASHDLQEPLRKISTFSDRLQAKYSPQLGPEASDLVDRMVAAVSRMRVLINDLLSFPAPGA